MQPAIIYEDEDIIVCKKPAGVATQTRRIGQADMESLLKNYRASKGELPYIGVVHRLDQPVEGVMVFAKNKEPDQNKTGGQILLCDDGRRAGKEKRNLRG